ncbi:MAG: cytochrome-c oxidase, cbb3-type subunit II, partial [Phycisphaerales bacterium]|nr:cytochrome-c oxidase, cbb3-type subunit II [Phycisphaerales bacterium]
WNGFITFGMIYWLAPRLFQTKLFSQKLAESHFWLATVGILLYVLSMYVAAITEGGMLRGLDESGQLKYAAFIETVTAVIPMYWIRVIGGAMFLTGGLMMAYNVARTWMARPAAYDEPVYEAPALAARPPVSTPAPSRIHGHVVEWARQADALAEMRWHRRWERLPVRFTVYTLLAVVVASLFEIIPTFVIQSNVPTIASVKPYTPLELAGRDIYIAEGCYNCHSQMIRPILAETIRYGEYSKAGEFVYDHPFQWGSRRLGPDLARIGGYRGADWHILHFQDPRQASPGSIMPRYPWLLENKLDLASLPRKMRVMTQFGVPYSEEEVANCVAMAERQANEISALIKEATEITGMEDREVVALIAYLDRLGRDLTAPPPAAEGPATTMATEGTK